VPSSLDLGERNYAERGGGALRAAARQMAHLLRACRSV
jgi:hypothetical protein